ncbi:F-box domain-containing protein [Mycena kentingensis (nom. inval.)]|nr:F-box domain-containing protein [Mycena kentingensis (nom. inval.)]
MPTLEQILPESDREYLDRVATLRTCATLPGPPSRIPRPDELNAHFKKLVASWVPHPFSPEEREQVRREGLRYLIIAHKIQEVQRDIHPRRLPAEIESQLAFAKQSYLLRFWRIFRINDLPPEILLNILRFVVWDSFRTPVPARLQLTATCHPWRELLLADSTVWNAIWFRGDLGPRHDRAWAWFERARQSLLDVRIDTDANVLSGDEQPSSVLGPDQMRILLHRLFEKLSTIRMLIVTTDDWESALVVLELLSKYALVNGAPHLERFELHRGGLKNEDRKSLTWPKLEAQPFLAGMHPPSLTYLSLNGIPVDWAGSVLQNLTTLDMRRLPATYSPDLLRFREILLNCPRLVKLSMDGAGPKFEEYYVHNPLPAIDLPELMTLVLADFTLPYAQYCVAQLTAPNVNDLTLMNLCGEDYLPLFRQMTGMFPKVQLFDDLLDPVQSGV